MNKKSVFIDNSTLKNLLTLVVGQQNILFFDEDNLLPYLKTSRGYNTGKAFAVIFPSSTAEIIEIVNICTCYKIPMVAQGGNTGRCFGAQSKDPKAIIINLKKMNRIRKLDIENQTVTVEAGCILQDLQNYVAKKDLFFPLSLGAEEACQIGGNLATNAGGINVLRYGNTRDLTMGIEAVMPNGMILNELYELHKNNTGYDLKSLLIGSEGTLAIITAATFKLFAPENNNEHGFIAVDNVTNAVKCLRLAQRCFTNKLSSFELIPNIAISFMEKHSSLRCPISNKSPWYIWYKIADSNIEKSLFDDNANFLEKLMKENIIIDAKVAENESMKQYFWHIRETIVEVQKNEGASLKFDISVPISAITKLINTGTVAAKKICPNIRPYLFGHLGDGNLHYNLTRPQQMTDEEYLQKYKEPLYQTIYDIVDSFGGAFSAEHGVGSEKIIYMQKYKDPVALLLMRQIKQAFDPLTLMNPHKVVPSP